jgi:hypothetical protein
MFFLIVTTNLAIYLSSLQLLGSGSTFAGGLALAGGALTTSVSVLLYKLKASKIAKKAGKKLIPDCDCLPDCDRDCPCGCD